MPLLPETRQMQAEAQALRFVLNALLQRLATVRPSPGGAVLSSGDFRHISDRAKRLAAVAAGVAQSKASKLAIEEAIDRVMADLVEREE